MRWDVMCWSRCLLVCTGHGFMTARTDEFLWNVGKWLRSSAEIGRAGGRRMSRFDDSGLECAEAFTCYGEIAMDTGRRWKDCLGA